MTMAPVEAVTLEPALARSLKRSALTQILLFAAVAVCLTPVAGVLGFSAAWIAWEQSAPALVAVMMAAIGVGFGFLSVASAWLSFSNLLFFTRLPAALASHFDGPPVKCRLYSRSPRTLVGAWLLHETKKHAVDLSLFERIPETGHFRFRYILRPGFAGTLVPRLVIGFEPLVERARPVAVAAAPGYYAVNERPVKLVPTPEGGLDVMALDMRTGEFVRDMSYLSRCLGESGDVDALDAAEFEARVAAARRAVRV